MATRPKTATMPDRTVEMVARKAGAEVRRLWQMRGPPNTSIKWMECLSIGKSTCIVQTFEGGGWEAYTPGRSNRVDDTLADVLNRCGVPA